MTISAPHWDLTNVYPSLDSKQFKNAMKQYKTLLDEMETFLAKIVIPLSLSWSLLSRMRSSKTWFSLKSFAEWIILSTKVVLPWSTWAMMAMFLIFCMII